MKQLNIVALFCIVYLGFATSSFAQNIKPIKSRFSFDESMPIFNKVTGARMPHEDFRAIIRKNPRVHLEREIDERGEVAILIYDPNGSGFTHRDPSKRTKPNQPFPNFIFTTTTNDTIDLQELKGKIVVLHFNFGFEEPFTNKQKLADFEKTLKASAYRDNIVPIIVTHSNEEQIAAFKEKVNVPYAIVANGVNFFDKYIIMKAPTYIVIKKDGKLGAYADDLTELRQALLKAK